MEYLNDGDEWIVDIDLEKFFDTVNQDKLITIIGKTITDGDVVLLIRKYLSAGVMEKGIVKATTVGTPPGSSHQLLQNCNISSRWLSLSKQLNIQDLIVCFLLFLSVNHLEHKIEDLYYNNSFGFTINYLKQSIDIYYSMQMAQDVRLLKICNFCEKAFIANNPKAEYDTPHVRIKLMYMKVEEKLYLVM